MTDQAAATASRASRASLARPLAISGAVFFVLACIAFWPTPRWKPPPRPAATAPIVFDELVKHPPPPSDAALVSPQ